MKRVAFLILVVVVIFMGSCSSPVKDPGIVKKDISEIFHEGSVEWYGGKHNGTILIKDNNLEFDEGILSGGYISIDMSTLRSSDLSGDMRKKFEEHLKSDDFFGVKKYPIACIKIDSIKGGDEQNTLVVLSDLTIKGTTLPYTFIVNYKIIDNKVVYASNIDIDRSKFGVKYGSLSFFSNLGDKAINDVFTVKVHYVVSK